MANRVAFKSAIRKQISAAFGLLAQRAAKRRNVAVRRRQTGLRLLYPTCQRSDCRLIGLFRDVCVSGLEVIGQLSDAVALAGDLVTLLCHRARQCRQRIAISLDLHLIRDIKDLKGINPDFGISRVRVKLKVLTISVRGSKPSFPGNGLPLTGECDVFIFIIAVGLADFILAPDQHVHRPGNTLGFNHNTIFALTIKRQRLVVVGEDAWAGSGRPVQLNPSLTITEVAESDARRILGIPRSCTLQEIVVRDQVVTGVSGSGQGIIQVRDAVTLAGNRIPLLGDRILQRRQRLCICLIRQINVGLFEAVSQISNALRGARDAITYSADV